MTRIAFIGTKTPVGSRYKYLHMFSQLGELVAKEQWDPRDLLFYDVVVCYGDRWPHWQLPASVGMPYVLCQHDTNAIRTGGDITWEKQQVGKAAAVIFTTEVHQQWLAERMKLPPTEVVHLRPLKKDLDFEPLPKKPNTIVYAGGLVGNERINHPFGYRIYKEPFQALLDGGWEVHAYPAWVTRKSPHLDKEYPGVILHEPVPQSELYKELSQYEVGLQGYGIWGCQDYLVGCRPNKLWEYQAAGIPTVGFNAGDMTKIYDGKWGLVSTGLEDLSETARRASQLTITDEMRYAEVMDVDLYKFANVLNIALTKERPPKPPAEEEYTGSRAHRPFRVVTYKPSRKSV